MSAKILTVSVLYVKVGLNYLSYKNSRFNPFISLANFPLLALTTIKAESDLQVYNLKTFLRDEALTSLNWDEGFFSIPPKPYKSKYVP